MSASLAPECNEVKERYDSCFLKWYSEKFLRGNTQSNDCESLFQNYQTCLKKALKDRGIDTMLQEASEANGENDTRHLKKSCGYHRGQAKTDADGLRKSLRHFSYSTTPLKRSPITPTVMPTIVPES